MLQPLNTEWNRKTGILPGSGQVIYLGTKHGIIYFTWTGSNGAITFLQADEGTFKKHFNFSGPVVDEVIKSDAGKLDALIENRTKFLKYPTAVPVLG